MSTSCNFCDDYRTREPFKGSTFVLIVILFILLSIVGSRLEIGGKTNARFIF